VNAAPDAQLRLLDLQAIDSGVDRLRQRRRTLPEVAELEQVEARLRELADDIVRARTEIDDVTREVRKLEMDVDVVRTRADKDQQRLDGGQVGSPRELENLQHEIGSLAKRQGDLEEELLERMEVREAAETRLRELETETLRLRAEREAVESRRDATYDEIDAEVAQLEERRGPLAMTIPNDLIELYEKVRQQSAGVGAAALYRARCEGCMLTLSPVDLERFKRVPDDEVLRCEECRRILIRRPDSF
jgi:predicted  nucleic acid-binding Zn-ribbon protein